MRLCSSAVALAGFTAMLVPSPANAQKPQSCPTLLAEARRLVLVTADRMNAPGATMQLFERGSPNEAWRQLSKPEPAVVGKTGIGWSQFFRALARPGEPIKVEGDKRAPAGIYAIGRSFGVIASTRPGYLHVTPDTICVDDPSSPAYNTIASRAQVGAIHAENMSQILPMYRRGLLVDYPTDARRRAGSCIFIHVWRSPVTGTAGCVALPEPRVEALQDFAQSGAVLAILPTAALDRLPGCLPKFSR
jgi:L,D-peptidoglycan transpeptidase YkuD (ErfK/YbiS/YcfS/YnhG family)